MPDLRSKILRVAEELPQGDPTRREILSTLRQASPKVTRNRGEGFIVEGGAWPRFIIDKLTSGNRSFPGERFPDKIDGPAHYQVKTRSPDAYVLPKGTVSMSWRSPTRLVDSAQLAYFHPMGRSEEDFTALFGPRSQVSTKGGIYQVEFATPKRNPVDGLRAIVRGPFGMSFKIPLKDIERDGVLMEAPVEIGGTEVGTVLIPRGLTPTLEDLRGLFG